AALDDGERALRLERPAEALGRKHQHLAGQRDGKRREAGADAAIGQRLVPDLVLQVVPEMLRVGLAVHQRHRWATGAGPFPLRSRLSGAIRGQTLFLNCPPPPDTLVERGLTRFSKEADPPRFNR